MDGLTVADARDILTKLEPGIQGQVAYPLGWLKDAVEAGRASLEQVAIRTQVGILLASL